jgi:hypothetical protein
MTARSDPILRKHVRGGGKITEAGPSSWHLEIPAGSSGSYRLAQLDDYGGLSRRSFPWKPPINLRLRARASALTIPGTWGFGLWNDPFGVTLVKGSEVRFPSLPNSAWFFFASEPNYLSFRDDLPAQGQLAAVFRSPVKLPPRLIASIPLIPFFLVRPVARWLRRLVGRYVHQDTLELDLDPTLWHTYEMDWRPEAVIFHLDGQVLKEMSVHPNGPLGLVMWVDNQFASWSPNGGLGYGTLKTTETSWIEVEDLELTIA